MTTAKHTILAKSLLVCFIVLAAMFASSVQTTAQELTVSVKLSSELKEADTRIIILKDSLVVQSFTTSKKKVRLSVDFEHNYSITFQKVGCEEKSIHISTKEVPLHMQYELLDFGFEVTLESTEHLNPESNDSIAAKWHYHSDFGEFVYENFKDQSETIQSEMMVQRLRSNALN